MSSRFKSFYNLKVDKIPTIILSLVETNNIVNSRSFNIKNILTYNSSNATIEIPLNEDSVFISLETIVYSELNTEFTTNNSFIFGLNTPNENRITSLKGGNKDQIDVTIEDVTKDYVSVGLEGKNFNIVLPTVYPDGIVHNYNDPEGAPSYTISGDTFTINTLFSVPLVFTDNSDGVTIVSPFNTPGQRVEFTFNSTNGNVYRLVSPSFTTVLSTGNIIEINMLNSVVTRISNETIFSSNLLEMTNSPGFGPTIDFSYLEIGPTDTETAKLTVVTSYKII